MLRAKRSWKTEPEQRQAYINALINEGIPVNENSNTFDSNIRRLSKLDSSQMMGYFTIENEPGMIYWYYEGDERNEGTIMQKSKIIKDKIGNFLVPIYKGLCTYGVDTIK